MSRRPVRGVGAGGAQQHMVGLVLAQHVIDKVGRDGDLAARLLLSREPPLDQAGNDRAIAEHALHQRRFGKPGLQIVAQHVLDRTGASSESSPRAMRSAASPRPQTASAYSLATKPSGRSRARSSRRVSNMPSV